MSSGGKTARGSKGSKGNSEKSGSGSNAAPSVGKPGKLEYEKERPSVAKIPPTAEQLRLARMIDGGKGEPDKVLQEKITQVMNIAGVTNDDAFVALHDFNNDVNAAIESLLEGEDLGQWQESSKKKKKTSTSTKNAEMESNKENRRIDSRERSGSRPRGGGPPRFRGRGGRLGGKEADGGDGPGRGGGGPRRGRMANGGPLRGRGGRSRGMGSGRTFQNRQVALSGFPENIDTWGPQTEEKTETQDNLQIDNWDDDPNSNLEDWDNEWTGSLEQTTVFGPSSSSISAIGIAGSSLEPISEQTFSSAGSLGLSNSISQGGITLDSMQGPSLRDLGSLSGTESGSGSVLGTTPTVGSLQSGLPDNLGSTLSVGRSAASTLGSSSQTYSASPAVSSSGMGGIDIAALLQKTAPHSNLGRMQSSMSADNSSLGTGQLGSTSASLSTSSSMTSAQHSILSGINAGVEESLKAASLVNNTSISGNPQPYSSAASQPYSPASISNSLFSTSGLHSSISGSLEAGLVSESSKVMSLSASGLSRNKPQRRIVNPTSKIPLSAVEMPEDPAMAGLEMQFTGLEFGTDSFDFSATADPSGPSVMGLSNASPVATRDHAGASGVTSELTSLNVALSQSQSLGPEPMSFPNQGNERKPSSAVFGSTSHRSVSAGSAAQSLSELTKKDQTSSGTLGGLVGAPSSTPSYTSSYGSSKASSFPSPPSIPFGQTTQNTYSAGSTVSGNSVSYAGSNAVVSNSSSSTNTSGNQSSGYVSSFSGQGSSASGQYQNSYVNTSSHSSLGSMGGPKALAGLKESAQSFSDVSSGSTSNLSTSLASTASGSSGVASNSVLSSSLNAGSSSSVQSPKSTVPVKSMNSLGSSVPPGVSHSQQTHQSTQQLLSASQQPPHSLSQTQHTHQLQQSSQQAHQLTQQAQQQLLAGPGPSQFVSPPAALQGGLPPYFNLPQQAMYSYEDLQILQQQRMPHMQQAPTTLQTARDGTLASPAYSMSDVAKYRTDQNSSPVPSTLNQQGAAAAGTYITATGSAPLPPFYMYHNMAAVPSTFPQYGTPTIIQFPQGPTGSNSTQYPSAPKLQYGAGNYYDNISQTQDYKTPYGSAAQGQSKSGPNSATNATNSASDLAGYKNHISKVSRSYDKQGFHTATPPPFNIAGSGTNPMTGNPYAHMFIPAIPPGAAAQHGLVHHTIHQDGTSTVGQRTAPSGAPSKVGTKPSYGTASFWGSN